MPRKYNIRWTEDDNQQIRKAVKNFNAKITRLEKKLGPQKKNALPERVTAKALKELVTTRSDLKRELNALRRFSEKGAEQLVELPDNDYNTQITKWQRNEMLRRAGVINRKRTQRYKEVFELPATRGGKELGYTVGQQQDYVGMGQIAENELKPINPFTPSMTRSGAHHKFMSLKIENQDVFWQRKEEILRQNYINELLKDKFTLSDIKDIVKQIEELPFNDFYKTFLQEGGTMEDVYPPKRGTPEYNSQIEHLKSIWLPNYKE